MRNRVVRWVLAVVLLLVTVAPLAAQAPAGEAVVRDRPGPQVLRAAPPEAPPGWRPDVGPAQAVGAAPGRQAEAAAAQACNLLLVDDDWDYQYTHPGSLGGRPFYTSAFEALGLGYDVWDVQTQGQPTGAAMAGRNAVIWFTGYAYSELNTDPGVFTPQNETRVATYLNTGGSFVLSSQEYYFDCCDEADVLTPFMQNYLGLADINDDVVVTTTLGIAGNPIGDGLGPYTMARPDDYGLYWPEGVYQGPADDEVIKRPEADSPFRYDSPWNTGLSATNYVSDTFKTMYLGWPLEWIDTVEERAQILGLTLAWMGCTWPAPVSPTLAPIDNADGNAEYMVDWDVVTGATGYVLEEDDNPAFATPATRYGGANSAFEVWQQAPGTWYYRVRSHSPAGNSGWSNTRSATVTIPAPLPPVLASIANPEHGPDFRVEWSDVVGATGYTLEEDEYPDFYSPHVRYIGTDAFFEVTGQPAGTWYFRVRAATEGGRSIWSNVQSVGVVPLPPFLNAIDNQDGDGTYVVSWHVSVGATGYTLQEDDNPDFTSPTVRYSGVDIQKMIQGQPGGTWFYRVRASNAFGDGLWSVVQSTSVLPAAPLLLPISNADGDGHYTVDWNKATGAVAYSLEEDDNPDFASPTERYSGPDTQTEVTGQPTGTWYYRVRASNPAGNGPWSNRQTVVVTWLRVLLPLVLRHR